MSEDKSDRLYPRHPMPGVGALVWNGSQVLLERRGQPPREGIWTIPGGMIEVGETAEQAVVREVQEECGIVVRPGPLLGLFEPIDHDPDGRVRYHYVVIDFLAYYESGTLARGDDAAEVRWVAPADLGQYDLYPDTQAMIERGLALVNA